MKNTIINEFYNIENDCNKIDNKQEDDNIVLGIDLGTSNSCVSIWKNNKLIIIPDEFGNNTIPSIVAFTNINTYIGNEAKNQKDINCSNVFYEVKRLIGKKINDEFILLEKNLLSYEISGDENDNVVLIANLLRKKKFTPEEISSKILMKLKNMSEKYLNCKINKAVITIPAYFNDAQRQATKDAGMIAGLDVIRLINEPTASSLAYGLLELSEKENKDINIIVYDFGGGTLDISVVGIDNGIFEVYGSTGNTHLGGVDFDNKLLKYCLKKFKKQNNIEFNFKINALSLQKLRLQCENVKKKLSLKLSSHIKINNFYDNIDMNIKITRSKLENICNDLLLLAIKPLDDILKICKKNISEIDQIILVGGMTKMPKIRENIKNFFTKEPNCSIDPNTAISCGAAIQGYILTHKDDPFSENITLLDVTALSLGIETTNGIMNFIIPRNTCIPVTKSKRFTCDTDNMTNVIIKIFEGERKLTKDNFFVGEFELSNIEPVIKGLQEIEVKFHIDINGIITVTAEDLKNKNGNKKEIIVTGNKKRLTIEQIEELILEAKNSEYNDKIEREKRQTYYEYCEIIKNIKLNLNANNINLKKNDIDSINQYLKEIEKWENENKYEILSYQDYEKKIKDIKERYPILTLHGNNNITFNDLTTNIDNATNLYDDNEEQQYANCEKNKKKINNDTQNSKQELLELCNNIENILSKIKGVSKNDIFDIRSYIDDTFLWININDNLTNEDINNRIVTINNMCNDIVNKFNIIINTNEEHIEYKLKYECLFIKYYSNNKLINKTLDWMMNNIYTEETLNIYEQKYKEIHNLYLKLYNKINKKNNKKIISKNKKKIKKIKYSLSKCKSFPLRKKLRNLIKRLIKINNSLGHTCFF